MKNTKRLFIPYFKAVGLFTIILSHWTILSVSVGWAQTGPSITVKDESWVKDEKVYLKDVSVIDGNPTLQERLGMIQLAFAPKPGKYKTLQGAWIASKVRSNRWLPENTLVKIPEHVRVGRLSQFIDNERLFRQFTDFIAQREGQGADFRILRFKVVGNGPIPEGNIGVELTNRTEGKLMGRVSLPAIVRVDGKQVRRLVLSGWIDRFEDVVCAIQPLERGTVLTPDDLCLEKRNISKLPANVLRSSESLAGKRLKRSVKAGTVLLANAVDVPPLIKKGDRVTIVVESSSLRIMALGVAKGQGSAGDQIRVKNLMNDKEIVASVVDSSTVRVHF
jgi:flagella basal body P-ring formation protein FlgA